MNRTKCFFGICLMLCAFSLKSAAPTGSHPTSNLCSRPELLQADQITDTQALLSWTDVADAYDVELRLSGQPFTGVPTHVLDNDPPLLVTGLLPGQNYRYVVRARCSGNEVSEWSNPRSFATELNNNRPCPLNFDLRDTSCASQVQVFNIHVDDAPGTALGVDVHFNALRLVIEHTWRSDLRIWLRSPDGTRVQVVGGLNAGDRNLGNPEAGDCAPFLELTEQAGALPLSAAAERDNVTGLFLPLESFAPFANGQNPNGIWKLEICDAKANDKGKLRSCGMVFSRPGCDPPAGVTASNVDANSADIAWTPDATGDSILVEYGLYGFYPGSGAAAGPGGQVVKLVQPASLPVVLNGLQSLKTYAVYVRRQCAPGFWGPNSPALVFETNCPATLLEGVDTLANCPTGCADPCALPGLWQNVGGDDYEWKVRSGPGHTYPTAGPPSASGGTGKYLFFRNSCTFNGAAGKKAFLRTRCVQVFAPASAPCHFSLDLYMNTKTGQMGTLEMQVSTDGGQSWATIRTWSGNRGKQWRREYVNLSAYHNATVLFQLVATGAFGIYGDIAIDNLAFYGSSPAGTPDFVFYRDNDGDNYGVASQKLIACNPAVPPGYATLAGDCNDADASVNPGAPEVLCNQKDDNCNGLADDSILPTPVASGAAVCAGFDAVLSAIGPAKGTYYWFDAPAGGQVLGTGPTLAFNDAQTGGVFYLLDSITGPSAGCASARVPATLVVNPVPELVLEGDSPVLCPGSGYNLADLSVLDINDADAVFTYHSGFPTTPANQLASTVVSPAVPTIYYLQGTTSAGCKDNLGVLIGLHAAPQVSIAQGDSVALCRGKSLTLQATASAPGTPPHTYAWSNGLNLASIPVQASMVPGVTQTYTVTITDANQCTATDAIKIHALNNVSQTAILEIHHVEVCGGNDGFIRLNPLDGTPPYQLSWSGPVTGTLTGITGVATIAGLTQGGYRVTVSDASGACNLVLPQIVINAPGLQVAIDTVVQPACPGAATGSIALQVSGVNPVFTWSNSQTGPVATGLATGLYGVTVSDGNCSQVLSNLEITAPPPAQLVLNGLENVRCFGENSGSIYLAVFGATPPYQYAWSQGATTQDIAAATAGTYTCTVTDANGCTFVAGPYTVSQPPLLDGLLDSLADVRCYGENNGYASVTITGGTQPYAYAWNSGDDTSVIGPLEPGLYQLTVTDAEGCTLLLNAGINEPLPLEASSVQLQSPGCVGVADGVVEIIVEGGVQPYAYLWNTGQTTAVLYNREAGLYAVTVTDQSGCTFVRSNIVLDAPQFLTATVNALVDVACFGENTGAISVSITGAEGQTTVSWNGIPGPLSLQNLAAGTYVLEVSDERSCALQETFVVEQPAMPLAVQVEGITDLACAGDPTGRIEVQTTGGTPPYQFAWSYPGYTNEDLLDVPAGAYDLFVTDANGCSFLLPTQTIQSPPALVVTPVIQDIPCFGPQVGSIQLAVQGGTGGYSYAWNDGQTTPNIYNLQTGTYAVTVFDGIGCAQVLNDLTVRERESTLVLETTFVEPVSCNGAHDGRIGVRVLNGTAPYQFAWSSPVGLHGNVPFPRDTAEQLQGGMYSLTLSDAAGCTAQLGPVFIEEAPLLTVGASEIENLVCKGDGSGRIAVLVSGGLPGYQYLWSNGATTPDAENLSAGTYRLTVTDQQGCTAQTPLLTVSESATALTVTVNNVQNDVCGTGNGSVTASAAGGNPPLMYLWSNGDTLPTSSGLTAGTYQLTVTDQSGCQVSTPPVTLTSNGGPFGLSVVQISDVACYGDSTGTIVVQAVNGTAPYVYAWSNGSLSPVQTQLPAGNYTLTLVDASGCVTVEAFDVDQPAAALQTGWQSDSLANGWSVTLLPQGGTPPYDALWDAATGNQTGLTASGLASGAYSVTLTDAQGCTEVVSGIVAGTNRADGPEESLHMVLYPNPAWGDAFLTLSGWNPKALQVKVTDSSGRCLYDETLQVQGSNVSLTVPSASWPDGWYWVRVMDPETGQWAVRTLVRNRQ